jgi:hypothetical protein
MRMKTTKRASGTLLVCVAGAVALATGQVSNQELRDVAIELIGSATPNATTAEVGRTGPVSEPWSQRGGAFRIDLYDSNQPPPASRRLAGRVYLLVTNDGVLRRLSTEVPDVERRAAEFKAAFETHPGWTDQDAIRVLRNSGAKFVPPEGGSLVKQVSLRSLAPWLTVVSFETPKFEVLWQPEDSAVHRRARTLNRVGWHMLLRARLPDGSLRDYGASLEPFSGTITYLATDTR